MKINRTADKAKSNRSAAVILLARIARLSQARYSVGLVELS
jgi:hypothetical protein